MLVSKQKRKPRYRRQPSANLRLQTRDAEIIYHIYRHRFLTSAHIKALVPGGEQAMLRRLQKLYHAGYLDRPPEQIRPYRLGSTPMVYGLGNKGADLLTQKFNIKRSKVDWTSKNREVKQLHLDHTLMVAHFMVCLELACREVGGIELIGPEKSIESLPAKKQKQVNPFSWRINVTQKFKGENRKLRFAIVPDKVFGLYLPGGPVGQNKALYILEADRSTMPVMRNNLYLSSYFKKMIGYWATHRQEKFKEIFGFSAARVLTVTKSRERIDTMIAANKEADPRGKGTGMFLFAEAKEFTVKNPDQIFKPVWRNGRNDDLESLLN